jgi:hypothetical protein
MWFVVPIKNTLCAGSTGDFHERLLDQLHVVSV